MVEGAFVDEWISNSYTSSEELGGLLPNGITPDLQSMFREMLLDPDTDEVAQFSALANGAKTYPELIALIPTPPKTIQL